MTPIVGVFRTRADAEKSLAALKSAEIAKTKIHLLTPETSKQELASVPTLDVEQPGIGKALGAVVGGAMGLAGGLEVAEALTALLPGVGVIVVFGLTGSALLTALGAFGGGAIGGALENSIFNGLPEEELFVYKDALRKGRSVLLVSPSTSQEADFVHKQLVASGAESIDQAREDWWLGLRDVEKEKYEINGGDFDQDEPDFRAGFEASHRPENLDKTYEQANPQLAHQYPEIYDGAAFRLGYQRGRLQHVDPNKSKN